MPCRATRFCLHAVVIFTLLYATLPLAAQDRRGVFTAPPRSVRSREIDQQHIRLELDFDFDQQQIDCRALQRVKLFQPLSTITLDAADLQIQKVTVRATGDKAPAQEVKSRTKGQAIEIPLGREYPADAELKLDITYVIKKPKHGAHFVLPDASEPDQPKMVWTQSEPEFARYWYPCFDSPSDRLTSEIIATVPAEYVVLSNGVLKEKSEPAEGRRTWHWVQAKSHVPYLLSVVAGDFEMLEQAWDGIPIVAYVPRGRLADAPRSFHTTPAMVQYFSEKIGVRYPWEKYAQICVDEYNWGGMEHTSATTLNLNTLHDERAALDVSSDNLVAHELAHQWWGDLLTCKDWAELWLNESFATYFATLWTEHHQSWDEAAWERRKEALSYLEEDKRYRRPIVTYRYPRADTMFDRHTYPKGGRVLHMLRFVLGDDDFWKALRRYAEVNQFRTVETADLRKAIEDSTGQGLNWFFDQWVAHGGHPEFQVSWEWDAKHKSLAVVVKQTQKVDDLTPLFEMPVELEIGHGTSTQTRRIRVSKAEETFHFELSERPTRVVFDPRDWILKTLTGDKSKEEWLDQLTNSPHIIPRADAVEELAKLKDQADVVTALGKAAREDAFWGVRETAAKALGALSGDDVRLTLIEVAQHDEKSFVRRAALDSLGKFKHDSTNAALRKTIAEDPSYYAVAEALKSLVKVDRDACEADLLAALQVSSDRDVILRAACDGLAELKSVAAVEPLSRKLEEKLSPGERIVVLSALAKLKPDDDKLLEQLHQQLDNDRGHVRRIAIDTVTALATPQAADWLLELRNREENPRMVQQIDEAIEKIRAAQKPVTKLQEELEKLRAQNKKLEERLQKLEQKD